MAEQERYGNCRMRNSGISTSMLAVFQGDLCAKFAPISISHQEYVANETAESEEFEYANLTVDNMFFDHEHYRFTIGQHNVSLEDLTEEYNLTETVYGKVESLTSFTDMAADMKDVVFNKMRSTYQDMSRTSLSGEDEVSQILMLQICP